MQLNCAIRAFLVATGWGLLLAVLFSNLAYGDDRAASAEISPEAVLLRQGDLRLPVSLRCPRFTIDGAEFGGKPATAGPAGEIESGRTLHWRFAPIELGDSSRLEVKLIVEWSAGESVLRKWAAYRLDGARGPKLVSQIVLEDLDTAAAGLRLLAEQPVDSDDVQSRPVFFQGFFAGIEYPVARSRVEGRRLLLLHRPGLKMQPGTWCETRKAVYGVAPPGEEKRAFERYIDAHRPAPRGIHHFIYNPYWSTPTLPSQQHIREVMQSLADNLYKPYAVAFDSCGLTVFTTDPQSIWKVDGKRFPRGLADLQQLCGSIGSRLDIFLSPSSMYPPALDYRWAEAHGYETRPFGEIRTLCLGGKRYQSETKKTIVDTVCRYRASHVFLDGYLFDCPANDHGHEPGVLSAEPICDGLLDILAALRRASPDVWLAATCFHWNPSPWWCFHVNSVLGCYGDDAPYGRVPSPVYRESYTSARDFFNLQGAYWLSIPIAAEESFGVIHQSNDPLLNDAVTDILRGNMEQHCAINPAYMNAVRWRQFALLVNWARRNADMLQATQPLLPRSWQNGNCPRLTNDARMPREPYGYAHWRGDCGIVMLRNPWIEPQTYRIRLPADLQGDCPDFRGHENGTIPFRAESHGVPAAARLSAVSIYPEARVYGTRLKPGDILDVPLAPYETVVLSVGATRPPPNIPAASEAIRRRIDIAIGSSETSLEKFAGGADAPGADSTCTTGDAATSIHVKLEATVTRDAPAAEILILTEDKQPPIDPLCRLVVNGKAAALSSSGSETGWAASGLQKPERWLFLSAPLARGKSQVSLDLRTRGGAPRVSAWVWAKQAGSAENGPIGNALPQPETISLDAAPLLKPIDESIAARTTRIVPRPIERIDGAFLDAMDPAVVHPTAGRCERDLSIAKTPLVIAGRRYPRGIGVDCPSRIAVSLDGKYKRFQALAGLDSAVMNNYMDRSVIAFEVWVDGRKRWASGPIRSLDPPEPAKPVDVDVAGASVVELRVVSGDVNGHLAQGFADWAMARLLRD